MVVENGTERAEGGESESELDLLAEAETESDSDDQDNAESAQRSVQTGATQGSDAGVYNYVSTGCCQKYTKPKPTYAAVISKPKNSIRISFFW